MVSKKKVTLYLTEEGLADLLGYWSKEEDIPVEIEVISHLPTERENEMTLGPGRRPSKDMRYMAKVWLEEENVDYCDMPDDLEIDIGDLLFTIRRLAEDKVIVECIIELEGKTIDQFRQMSDKELDKYISDLRMVLSLKNCDFDINSKSGIPVELKLSSTIYADGYSKDRLMSTLADIRRTANLALTITNGEARAEYVDRTIHPL